MMLALYALLIATTGQDAQADPYAEPPEAAEAQADPYAEPPEAAQAPDGDVYAEEPVDAETDNGGTEDSYLAEPSVEPVAQPVAEEVVEPEPEEEQPTICKRRTVYDMIGRPRSTRVCRPRDAW